MDLKKVYVPVVIIEELVHVKNDFYQNLFDNFKMSEKFEGVSGPNSDVGMNQILIDFYFSICKFHGIIGPEEEEEDE